MTRPGTRLRTFAARVCSAATMERLIDPVIADLQAEHGEAVRAGRVWRSRWALVVGYIACAKVFALAGLLGAWPNWSRDDRRGLKQMAWYTLAITFGVSVLIGLPAIAKTQGSITFRELNVALLAFYLLPSTLVFSVPVGLAIGTTIGISGRPRSSRLLAAILLLALAGSAASFANIAWLTPAFNQLYREEAIGRPVPRGDRELTLSELQSSAGLFSNPRSFLFHARLVLAAAPLTFVVFGLVIATRRLTRTAAVMSVSAALVCCEGGLIWGAIFTANGVLPGPVAAWLPQVALIATTILVTMFVSSNRVPTTRIPA